MSAIRTNAAAALLGVSPNTLRSWESRFGYPAPRRSEGGHRQFDLAEIEALRQAYSETGDIGSAIAIARERGESGATPTRLQGAFSAFDADRADRILEESMALRSLERTVQTVLLPAAGALAGGERVQRPSDAPAGSPEYCFAWRYTTGWLAAAQRVAPPSTRSEGVLIFDASRPLDGDALHAQALELFLRRAGLRVLALPVDLDSNRIGNALRALRPSVLVLAGSGAGLDAIGRLVYAARQSTGEIDVLDFRGALPDSGASTVARIGPSAGEAVEQLRERLSQPSAQAPPGWPAFPEQGTHLQLAAVAADERHPLIPARDVDARQELPELELTVLQRWRERDVFAESLRRREGAKEWVFYEGPPTANGRPGSHHVLSRVFKDIYPRYKTMRGYRVQRKGGWDCHGLPVEIAVEQKLGISSKSEIEDPEKGIGIERFNEECRKSVFEYLEEWDRLTERIGFWVDLEHAYRTLDESYIESVWWALAEIDRKGLLYEGNKVVPYCPRCGTALSSHEVALGYKDVVDPSVYVRLPILADHGPVRAGDSLLIWTTTPWTLPGNVAVAAGPAIEYVRASAHGRTLIVAAAMAERMPAEHVQILERFAGSELIGAQYEGPIFATGEGKPQALPVIAGDFVTTEDGTGLVHIAPAFGEDDFRVAAANGLFDPTDPQTLLNPVRLDGTYDSRVQSVDGTSYEGRFVKDPQLTEELIADLDARGMLFRREQYEHSYPHCWRCGTPLIYYAKPSWYIATSKLREQMLAANETVNWYPPHIKHGRFGDWLSNNIDWALSRERYWGTPLPVWRCAQGHTHTIGSFSELEGLSAERLEDHHRPYVDNISFPCTQTDCNEQMRRVPEVIDVWFDSGAMPFAQLHSPHENEDLFEKRFPADFICEALDQTRGWFYSLLAVSTLLFDRAPYENVVCLGLILDGEGQKMSKSKGNTVEPWQVLDRYGADAFRWYFFTSKQPWDGYRFSEEAIGEGVRLFLKQLWSTYFFYALYAGANAERLRTASAEAKTDRDPLDSWALSRTAATAQLVAERLDDYDATAAGRAIAQLVDELSNWYVRRSRRRFWDGEPAAFATLRECLLIVAKLLAPFCPFVADEIYDNLDGELASVHLCDFPVGEGLPARDGGLEEAMAIARETVRLGLGARAQAKIKVRQPLAEAVVVADGRERAAIERLSEIVRDELNVRAVRFVAAAEELGEYEIKANYRTLGPLFGKEMPLAAEAIAALDANTVVRAVRDGEGIGISVGGREHTLTADDVLLSMKAPDGYSVEREGAHAVALELAIDDSLLREGRSREIVHAIQNARKTAGLEVEDRIELLVGGDPALIEAAREHERYLSGETLAVSIEYDGERNPTTMDYSEQSELEGLALQLALSRV